LSIAPLLPAMIQEKRVILVHWKNKPEIHIGQMNIIQKPNPEVSPAQEKRVVPVIWKVLLLKATDEKNDLAYRMSKAPLDRFSAVSGIVSSCLPKSKKLDKSKNAKRKLKA
jgi:hypothetical protein